MYQEDLFKKIGGCFACVNSGKGFLNYFENVFEGARRVYVIKGGPGTGKSGLMKKIALRAEKEGEAVLRVYCSSDPSSLDGVFLPERGIALTDGTAPHEAREGVAGLDTRLIDLGAHWNERALEEHREEILGLWQKKSEGFKRAYALLSAAEKTAGCARRICARHEQKEAAKKKAAKLLRAHAPMQNSRMPARSSGKGKLLTLPMTAFGMQGVTVLNGFEACCEQTLSVGCYHGAEFLLIESLIDEALQAGYTVAYSPDPVTLRPESVMIGQCSFCLRRKEAKERERAIDTRSLLTLAPSEETAQMKKYEKTAASVARFALEELIALKEHHFALEKIYGAAMDWAGVNEETERVSRLIFSV